MILYFLGALAALVALFSLRGERARIRHYRTAAPDPPGWPRAAVIVPVKGYDEGLRENLAALAALDYPHYELIIAARSPSDVPDGVVPAGRPSGNQAPGQQPAAIRLVFSQHSDAQETGEKISNLLAAVRAASADATVFAFADSDGIVSPGWLRALVRPLSKPCVGAATGYRWHTPVRPNLASLLRSLWNAVICGAMGPGDNLLAWGGATAIRRETFFQLRVPDWWRGAVSDDYRLAQAVHSASLAIAFAPGALVASRDRTPFGRFLSWMRRQLVITRIYAPRLWRLALISHAVYCAGMASGIALGLAGHKAGWTLLAAQVLPGMAKGWNRVRLARAALPAERAFFQRWGWAHVAGAPVGTWVWLLGCVLSAFGSRISWRGHRYRLRRLPPPGMP